MARKRKPRALRARLLEAAQEGRLEAETLFGWTPVHIVADKGGQAVAWEGARHGHVNLTGTDFRRQGGSAHEVEGGAFALVVRYPDLAWRVRVNGTLPER